ncbi:MAG TPA: hypothetical protein VKW04_16670 [Planctomycetota bacterium]|nr:hypothetical protein [Planctomycetota bacterium]
MGKLGVFSLAVAVGTMCFLLPAREAAAQDFGQDWIDRITHEAEQDRGPLSPKPFAWTADAGVQYAFDNNIFLTQSNKKSDSIVIPFVQAGLTYSESKFDIEANLLADYKYYVKENPDDDEERFFIRARQTSSRWNFEISELFLNVSDPSGVLFLNRVKRVVSTTVPKVAVDVARNWSLELNGNIQLVRFQQKVYSDGQENNNFSVDAAAVYHTSYGFDALGVVGYYNINYLLSKLAFGGTPDAFGYYGKVGFRGNIVERLSLEGTLGYSTVVTDFFPATGTSIHSGTMVFNANLKYEASDKVNFYLDGIRMYAFEGFGDPYQLISTFAFLAEVQLTEQLKFRGRLQFDYSESALHVTRDYLNANAGLSYKFSSHWLLDGSAGYRWGKTENVGQVKFGDVVLAIGIDFSW